MSLINDVLCDLQARGAAGPELAALSSLKPVQRPRRRSLRWLVMPLLAMMLATTAWPIWRNGVVDVAPSKLQADVPTVIGQPASGAAVLEPVGPAASPATEETAASARFASLMDFSRSLRLVRSQSASSPPRVDSARPGRERTVGHVTTEPDPQHVQPVLASNHKQSPVASQATMDTGRRLVGDAITSPVADPRRAGIRELKAGNVERATAHFQTDVNLDPADVQGWLYLVRAHSRQGDDEAVEQTLLEGLDAARLTAPLAALLARRLLERGADHEALGVLQSHRTGASMDPDYDALLAAVEQRLGYHAVAADRYRNLLAVRPDRGAWWVGLAISEEAQGNTEQALAAFRRARRGGGLNNSLASYAEQRIAAIGGVDRS